MSFHQSDHLSTTFAALAHPTRRAILARLASGQAAVNELAKPFDTSLPAVTKHLKVLHRAGLITQGRQAQWRPCRLDAAPLRDIAGWVEQYRQFWDESFNDRMTISVNFKLRSRKMITPNPGTETSNQLGPSGSSQEELVVTRIFDAPRELVFKTWIDPKQAAHWMGPRGFTAHHMEGELRPGGPWRLCLRPDDGGRDLWQGGIYRDVVEPARLVFTFAWEGEGDDGGLGPETLVTITFAEHEGGKTELIFHQAVFKSIEQLEGHRGGWSSTFDRLADCLHEIQSRGAKNGSENLSH